MTEPTSKPTQTTAASQQSAHGPHFELASLPETRIESLKLVRPRGTGYAIPELSRACLIRLIDFPEMPFRTSVRETIKAGRSALLVRTELPINGKMTPVAYKRVRRRNWLKKLTLLFRASRPLRAWRLTHEFLHRGIPTARPVAVILPRGASLGADAYLITEWIAGGAHPAEFGRLLRPFEPRAGVRRLHKAARRLGELIGRMHAQNVAHRDLKPGNVLLQDRDDDVAAYVIDLDGASILPFVSRRTRVRDLSRLAIGLVDASDIGRTARLRFLQSYLGAAEQRNWNWKSAWREIAVATNVRRIRKKKTGPS
ncbi:MAG: lipopolysaccharide kinase InaA family protein [Planctomycetaceae bacterium]